MKMDGAEGDSSGAEEDEEAKVSTRGACGQFVWPCPRQYPSDLVERQRQKWLKPADMEKPALGELFKDTLLKLGHGPNLVKLHVFDEPHKRYNVTTQERERHRHIIFKMVLPFAHLKVQKALAERGVRGHISFNLVGYLAYLSYCLTASAKKLAADLDMEPWSWPPVSVDALHVLVKAPGQQMAARNGQARGRKRTHMTFSELTDAFVEGKVQIEQEAWRLAKMRKVAGDDTLWNTLGAAPCVQTLVTKVRMAWCCEGEIMGTLNVNSEYGLDAFVKPASVSADLVTWMERDWKELTLIFSGLGGLGKTEMACAIMMVVAPAGRYHFLNKLDRLKDVTFVPGEGLVADEICLAQRDIDDAKALLDLAKSRDVSCRNKDGRIPKQTPRILTTNHSWQQFWPYDAAHSQHAGPIKRRILWITINKDLRVGARQPESSSADPANAPAAQPAAAEEDDEQDPFGFGGGFECL